MNPFHSHDFSEQLDIQIFPDGLLLTTSCKCGAKKHGSVPGRWTFEPIAPPHVSADPDFGETDAEFLKRARVKL